MTNYVPSQVFASITTRGNQQQQNIQGVFPPQKVNMFSNTTKPYENFDIKNVEKTDRMIKVTAVGEVSLPPDRCRVTINIHSLKDNVQDVKNSIQRRLDYVIQTLQNHNVKESDIQIHKSMRRAESMYNMVAEVIVVFLDFRKSQTACNLLVEKLDETVIVGMPEFYHAGTTLETLRQQASLLAVHNAKQKAQEMAKFVHQAVGKPICIEEEESKEWEGQNEGVTEVDAHPTVQQRIAQATVTVSCRVNVTFDLKPKVKTKSANS